VKSTFKHQDGSVEQLFDNYFSRFNGVSEPPFMPLRKRGQVASMTNDISPSSSKKSDATSGVQEKETHGTDGWAQIYAGHLAEDILSEDEVVTNQTVFQKGDEHPQMISMEITVPPNSSAEARGIMQGSSLHYSSMERLPTEDAAIEAAGVTIATMGDSASGGDAFVNHRSSLENGMRIHDMSTPSQAFEQFLDFDSLGSGLDEASWAGMIDQVLLNNSPWANEFAR
jgi:hypothetical protein